MLFRSTYSTWTVDGNKGIACVSQPGACGAYESEELCKQAGSNRVGRSSSYDVTCKGISGGMLWGNTYGYNPGNDPNWYGYKTMYDCVRCDNPLP